MSRILDDDDLAYSQWLCTPEGIEAYKTQPLPTKKEPSMTKLNWLEETEPMTADARIKARVALLVHRRSGGPGYNADAAKEAYLALGGDPDLWARLAP